jgi:peptide methionine sulfoxide reductase msrA/msrB
MSTSPSTPSAPEKVGSSSYPKPSDEELRRTLTPLQYAVTQHAGTEPPFRNPLWNQHDAGLYVDIVTGEPLFASFDKFESGTGWPSFVRPVDEGHVKEVVDVTHGMRRVEVRSVAGDSHLGHVFPDGPKPTGLRYCINSASLRFVPVAELEKAGYGAYAARFDGHAAAGEAVSEIDAKTDNACAIPPPGEAPGCSATLDVAYLGWASHQAGARALETSGLSTMPGVLDVESGATRLEGAPVDAVRVTFDPSKVSFADLAKRWTNGSGGREPGPGRVVFTASEEQKQQLLAQKAATGSKVAPVGDFRVSK